MVPGVPDGVVLPLPGLPAVFCGVGLPTLLLGLQAVTAVIKKSNTRRLIERNSGLVRDEVACIVIFPSDCT
jgi:hypothetical protein